MPRSDLGLERQEGPDRLERQEGTDRPGRPGGTESDTPAGEHAGRDAASRAPGELRWTPGLEPAIRPVLHPGAGPGSSVLAAGAADHLAALLARSVGAYSGLIHFVDGDWLRLYGGFRLKLEQEDFRDIPIADTLAGIVVTSGEPLIIGDVSTDERVPAGSPTRVHKVPGAYLGHPIRDEHGDVLGVCCAFHVEPREWTDKDNAAVAEAARVGTLLITEQIARHEVDRQRRFLDAVLDNLHDGVTACDADGRVVLVNARMQQLWDKAGIPSEPGPDGAIAGLSDAEGRPITPESISLFRALRGERLRDFELVLSGQGRRTRHYVVDATPITGPDGRTLGAVQAVQDVTRRKRAERFRTCELSVITALSGASDVAAAGPRVLEAVVKTLGWTHAELWLVDEAAQVVRSVAHWNAPGWDGRIEVPAELPYGTGLAGRVWQAGKPLWIRDVGLPQSLISAATAEGSRLHAALALPVRHGLEPLGVLTVFADTVENPDDELVTLMSGIAAHIGQFVESRVVEDLQRQLTRSKNDYLALIGHELRTPLTSIGAYTELLREADAETLTRDGPKMLEVIDRNTTALRHIINELLELSALDTGHAAVQLTPLDLAELVREALASARKAIAGEPLVIVEELPDRLIVPGDRRRLRQVVDNLVGNAIKYSPDGGRISVTLRAATGAAELAVSDTGIGVSADEREKMFTGLYRTSRARDRAIPGTGLGLTLSRAVVHRHHGSIALTEHDGPGTTVLVRLPLEAR